jgi:hypothetical protein
MEVKPSPKGKGLVLNLEVIAYDQGVLQLDTVPMTKPDDWASLIEAVVITINEFKRQVEQRRAAAG